MRHVAAVAILFGLCAILVGCKPAINDGPTGPATGQQSNQTPPEPTDEQAADPTSPDPAGFQPQYTLVAEARGSGHVHHIIEWTAEVNTGGWLMTTDEVTFDSTEDGAALAQVYVTLREPGPDEMVTQMMETLISIHDAGHNQVDEAELHVRRTQRNVTPEEEPEYELVKSTME